jgi:hypothetical protein
MVSRFSAALEDCSDDCYCAVFQERGMVLVLGGGRWSKDGAFATSRETSHYSAIHQLAATIVETGASAIKTNRKLPVQLMQLSIVLYAL